MHEFAFLISVAVAAYTGYQMGWINGFTERDRRKGGDDERR